MHQINQDNPIFIEEDDSDIEFIEERNVRTKQEPSDDIIDLATVNKISRFPQNSLTNVL
jgi:hypothetical protein